MKFKVSVGIDGVDIVPQDSKDSIFQNYHTNRTFEEAKAIAINWLEDEKERINNLLTETGNLTAEDCITKGKAREEMHTNMPFMIYRKLN